MLRYDKEFDPAAYQDGTARTGRCEGAEGDSGAGYAADDEVYVFDDERVVLAVNVALKTGRPLLLFGPPGSGKSSLAPNVARVLGWNYHAHVVTARTEPEDLLWRFDALKRLNDAQAHMLDDDIGAYYAQGPLWRAFAPENGRRSVVLLDEIDKADPDLPNSLLGPLGSLSFPMPWDDRESVSAAPGQEPFVVITSNDERELPRPFLRRCVVFEFGPPSRSHLLRVAASHLGEDYDEQLTGQVADYILSLRDVVTDPAAGPSTAEFLDALKACHQLGVTPGTEEWDMLRTITLHKRREGLEPLA
ncbi:MULTISPECIES: AAA family ATPase [Streptomyces]|uniref:ATPase associated with various cellular activities, AAA_5 n=1 Tax=Streptomyces venezuelae (strain ATCC 10712 / CBS 650.69 / DSM 40230 / JCM 4526 / NBRC 13096 / PD 04745) TaxID=953739 RepID=F2RDC4_STRVP|nr:MoxR family ATPase [Streptomyces venezuelae]CCA59416.1 ATPase associated with various cellular activities, AAA_5 [Streptomyces venezuelae ATCC 10712]